MIAVAVPAVDREATLRRVRVAARIQGCTRLQMDAVEQHAAELLDAGRTSHAAIAAAAAHARALAAQNPRESA